MLVRKYFEQVFIHRESTPEACDLVFAVTTDHSAIFLSAISVESKKSKAPLNRRSDRSDPALLIVLILIPPPPRRM